MSAPECSRVSAAELDSQKIYTVPVVRNSVAVSKPLAFQSPGTIAGPSLPALPARQPAGVQPATRITLVLGLRNFGLALWNLVSARLNSL